MLEFENPVTLKTTRPTTINAYDVVEGTIFIEGRNTRVLVDTETILKHISAALVTTQGIECSTMKEPEQDTNS